MSQERDYSMELSLQIADEIEEEMCRELLHRDLISHIEDEDSVALEIAKERRVIQRWSKIEKASDIASDRT